MSSYNPQHRGLTFCDNTPAFIRGDDTPSAYLERCIKTIEERDSIVQAFVCTNFEGARAAAEASTQRWREGNPLSPIDGMPIGIKDLLETKDMPTQMGCKALEGNFPKRDNTAVWALRAAGAVIIGKTVTAELGGSEPGPTTNPYDPNRTPGGSSSGSGAAVAADMVPACIGTQIGGSIIRPAAYCGNIALKPSQGAIHRGERQATSMSTHGVHANSIDDMWHVMIEIAKRTGGDPNSVALKGPDQTPAACKPTRLIVLETEGWPRVDAKTLAAFNRFKEALIEQGVEIVTRADHKLIDKFETSTSNAMQMAGTIMCWENRWGNGNLINQCPSGVSQRSKAMVKMAESLSPDIYETTLKERDAAKAAHLAARSVGDAVITLSCPGPAPIWKGEEARKEFRMGDGPTGDAIFNFVGSVLHAPVINVPLLNIEGLPVGISLMGLEGEDAAMTGIARWMLETLAVVEA